jgi:hypothetical protein
MRLAWSLPTLTSAMGVPRQLLAYRFGPESAFEGQLVGALERIESGGTVRIVDALFVGREAGSGELVAVSLTGGTAGMISKLLGFRLGEAERRTATERALDGEHGEAVRTLASALPPGAAVAAVLVEHAWATTLDEAVRRIGGAEIASESIDAGGIAEAVARLTSLVQPSG